MKSSIVLLLSIVLVNATHDSFSWSARHARISRRESTLEVHVRAVAVKRCPNLKNKAAALARSSVSFVIFVLDVFLNVIPRPSLRAVLKIIILLPQYPKAMLPLLLLLLRRLIITTVSSKSPAIVVPMAPHVSSFGFNGN